jgi:Chromo (CHRromatin Organisation MOdifier) domain
VGPYHDDWDQSLSLIEFAINNAWQESIQTTPFRAHQGYDPRTPLTGGVAHKCPAAQVFWDKHTERRDYCMKFMKAAQDRQKAYANKKRRDVTFAQGDAVMLSTTNVKFKATGRAKFMPRFMGPFIVTKVYGPQDKDGKVTQVTACKVKLPDLMKIHPVFHVALLKHFKSDGEPVPIQPLAYDKDGSPLWEVERVISERVIKVHKKKHVEYLVRWAGFAAEHDTWESADYIKEAAPQVVDAWQGYALRQRRIEAENNRNKKRNAT